MNRDAFETGFEPATIPEGIALSTKLLDRATALSAFVFGLGTRSVQLKRVGGGTLTRDVTDIATSRSRPNTLSKRPLTMVGPPFLSIVTLAFRGLYFTANSLAY